MRPAKQRTDYTDDEINSVRTIISKTHFDILRTIRHGETYKVLADNLKVAESTIKTRVNRAREAVGKALDKKAGSK